MGSGRPDGQRQPIAYPFAKTGGRTVSASEAERGGDYACLGCGAPMLVKRGSVKAHHFAHRTAGRCDPDHALHETAKSYVERLFLDARRLGKRLHIQHGCPGCGAAQQTDMAAGDSIWRERTVVPNTRSDLAVFRGGRPHMVIEVVVTHDIDDGTRAAYEKSRVLVVRVHPSWTAGGITCMVGESLNAPQCGACVMREYRLDMFLTDAPEHAGAPRLVTHDNGGRVLYPKLRAEANKQALRITQCGFTQQNRPTLFRRETKHWNIFADIDSTSVLAIWETNADAAVYAFPKNRDVNEKDCIPDCKNCVVGAATRLLEASGVHTRRYFLDDSHCWHEGRPSIIQTL